MFSDKGKNNIRNSIGDMLDLFKITNGVSYISIVYHKIILYVDLQL